MNAGIYPITIEQGVPNTLVVYLGHKVGHAAINITGYTARMQIRRTLNSPLPMLELTTENDMLVIDGDAPTVTIEISKDDADDLREGVYDLQLISPDGLPYKLLKGPAYISAAVTRD